jgi:hypothetical protein
MSSEHGGLEAQRELSRLVAQDLYGAIPDEADEIRLVITAIFVQYAKFYILLFRDGNKTGSLPSVHGLYDHVKSLRKAMYSPNGGTWFGAEFRVFRDGRMKASFNYDEEAVIDGALGRREVMSALYAKDLEVFPRSAAATPAWLAAKVEAGRAQIAQIEAEEQARRAEGE